MVVMVAISCIEKDDVVILKSPCICIQAPHTSKKILAAFPARLWLLKKTSLVIILHTSLCTLNIFYLSAANAELHLTLVQPHAQLDQVNEQNYQIINVCSTEQLNLEIESC